MVREEVSHAGLSTILGVDLKGTSPRRRTIWRNHGGFGSSLNTEVP